MKRRLPIGIQDFVSIREEGFCYVDKTARIHQLISGSGRAEPLLYQSGYLTIKDYDEELGQYILDYPNEEALAQIDTKEYLLPWTGAGKQLFKIGVVFDYEKRNIGEWKYV